MTTLRVAIWPTGRPSAAETNALLHNAETHFARVMTQWRRGKASLASLTRARQRLENVRELTRRRAD